MGALCPAPPKSPQFVPVPAQNLWPVDQSSYQCPGQPNLLPAFATPGPGAGCVLPLTQAQQLCASDPQCQGYMYPTATSNGTGSWQPGYVMLVGNKGMQNFPNTTFNSYYVQKQALSGTNPTGAFSP
jgi:hypothetical protein